VADASGPIYTDEIAERSRVSTVRPALIEFADALGDVDAFIEQYEEETGNVPKIARRLISADPSAGTAPGNRGGQASVRQWQLGVAGFRMGRRRIDVLEALGRTDDAQAARWECFERALSSAHLRAYLKIKRTETITRSSHQPPRRSPASIPSRRHWRCGR